MARLFLDHISKDFGGLSAVKDLTLEIEDGSVVAFLGPSGCGKTTTMRIIAGLEEPTSGRVIIGDDDVTQKPAAQRNIGMVFQFAVVYDSMNVFKNIALPLQPLGYSKDEIVRRVNEVARLLRLEEYLEKSPRGLNGALRQRMAIARAMVKPRNLYLLDEPLTNLDMTDRVQLRAELKKFVRMFNQTVIFVTHDQTEAMSIADKIVVMSQGELKQHDTCVNIYGNPASKFVASFIGTPSMNLLNCSFDSEKRVIMSGSLRLHIPESVAGLLEKQLIVEVTLGIRPEDIILAKTDDNPLEAEIIMTSMSGNRIVAALKVGEWELNGKFFQGTPIARSQRTRISLPRQKIRLFDRKTEKLIV